MHSLNEGLGLFRTQSENDRTKKAAAGGKESTNPEGGTPLFLPPTPRTKTGPALHQTRGWIQTTLTYLLQ